SSRAKRRDAPTTARPVRESVIRPKTIPWVVCDNAGTWKTVKRARMPPTEFRMQWGIRVLSLGGSARLHFNKCRSQHGIARVARTMEQRDRKRVLIAQRPRWVGRSRIFGQRGNKLHHGLVLNHPHSGSVL